LKSCKEYRSLISHAPNETPWSSQSLLQDGAYLIDSDGAGTTPPYVTFCDMTARDGGWTLIFPPQLSGESYQRNSDFYLGTAGTNTDFLFST
jgi:hypothetical protein